MEKEIMSKRTIRCISPALMLVAAVLFLAAGTAMGVTTGLTVLKDCPDFVNQGDTYTCTFSVQNGNPVNRVINLVVTDAFPQPGATPVPVDCTIGGVPTTTLATNGTAGDTCTGTTPSQTAPITCDTQDEQVIDTIAASGDFEGTILKASGQTDNGPIVAGLTCEDNNSCTTNTCTPNTGPAAPTKNGVTVNGIVFGCSFPPISCDDGNACTNDSCDTVLGCQHSNVSCDDSNACTNDSCDAVLGCQHSNVSCDDSNACTNDSCDAVKGCQHSDVSCDDSNACTNDSCDAVLGCQHSDVSCDDSNSCTDDSCDAVLGCQHTDNGTCNLNEICRTPGFWGTHACPPTGCEKASSQNITQLVLDETGPLSICGGTVSTTDLTVTSAVEAICVSPKGDSTLQLARQLTATALNCGVTKSTSCGGGGQTAGNVCSGVSIEDTFNACNDACASGSVTAIVDGVTINCIDALDCFNNGGTGLDALGACQGDSGCHEASLNNGCFTTFEPPGPAGSPKECNDARKDPITIIP
jgi:hypothetical protein